MNRPVIEGVRYEAGQFATPQDTGWTPIVNVPAAIPTDEDVVMELPRLGGNTWVRRTYWQLVLPRDEHVVVAPEACPSRRWMVGRSAPVAANSVA